MGHMLNNTIQDVLIRKARLEGKNACWVPGTDHASIATEAKVVKMLREQGIKKSDITREEFMKYAFEWKEKYGGIILEQLKKLGASCDWERTRFTLEESLSKAVILVFVDLFKKGKLYRGLRMTNWDPEAQTVLSNEEVIHVEENSYLYYVRYQIEGTADEWITIATTRPETILGDTAIAVNPNDPRFEHLKGKNAIVPLVNRSVPIIFDSYVDMEFGTGALKVTPAHDTNDYDIGQRHKLETIDVFNDNGTMSETAQFYIGEDRFEAKKLIIKDLEASGNFVKTEPYTNTVGRSERTNAVVEPRLTLQWFLDMKEFAKTALDAVKDDEVTFYPKNIFNMYNNWLNEDNVRDWCISRQLWWGQRIPAWYYGEDIFVAQTAEEALAQAKDKTGNQDLTIADLHQDEDVVDTWFSSWLWAISVFDGFENQDDLRYYYPTSVLVTGWDIMFFWVARMIMAGYEWSEELLGKEFVSEKGKQPFNDVYFTGMVRDKLGRKMSKSLGNSPDALTLIDKYGADGVRFGMLRSSSAGSDIIFDAPFADEKKKTEVLDESELCELGMKFCNKLWNGMRMLKSLEIAEEPVNEKASKINQLAGDWLGNKLNQLLESLEESYKTYRLSEALTNLYNFMWNDFSNNYLEMIKPVYGNPIDRKTRDQALEFFEKLMTILHPFMPFVTEEIWHQLKERSDGEDCVVSTYPKAQKFNKQLIEEVDAVIDVISKIRFNRVDKGMKPKEPLKLFVQKTDKAEALFNQKGMQEVVSHLAHVSEFHFTEQEEIEDTIAFVSDTEKYFLEVNIEIDIAAEKDRIVKELDRMKGFVFSTQKKLSNDRFVQNAPTEVVDKERKKLKDGETRIKILEESLSKLN